MADSSSADNHTTPEEPKRNRSTSFLRPEQLRRKRELDREGQRQLRARTKARIQDLEAQVADLTRQLMNANIQSSAAGSSVINASMAPSASIPESSSRSRTRSGNLWSGANHTTHTFIKNTDAGIDALDWADIFSSASLPPTVFPLDCDFYQRSDIPNQLPPPDQYSIPVWEAVPKHMPPTCRLDRILLDLIKSNRTGTRNAESTFEFSNARFPSVNALLNPEQQPSAQPVTSTIVKDVIYVQTVPTLPEQIAIMFDMCLMIRWQISPTEQNYDALPDFLKPVPAQLVTAHPAWIDTFPWPKARERLCRHAEYYDKHDYFKAVCNQTISINWPYEPSDTLLAMSDSEFMVNPIFEKHIRNLSNWTVGPQFLELFPAFKNDVNVGISRDAA